MATPGENTGADRHYRLTPDQMPPEPVCDGVAAGHGTQDAILDMVLGRLEDASHSGREWRARCPAHDDEKPSLNLRAGDRQPVVITCRAGCPPTDVLAAIGLTFADVSHEHGDQPPGAGEWTPSGPAVAVYDYTDAKGRLLYQVLRTVGKDFWQRRPDTASKTGWRWKLGNTRRVPYRLPRLLAAAGEPDAVAFIAEGERDVQAIEAAGGIATCNPGGAGNWRDAYSKHLAGFAEVIIIADKDEAGRKHAAKVAASLTKAGVPKFRIVEAAEGKDAADHLAKGHGLHDFVTGRSARLGIRRIPRTLSVGRRPDAGRAGDRAGLRPPPGRRLRRPAPVRARVAALAASGTASGGRTIPPARPSGG